MKKYVPYLIGLLGVIILTGIFIFLKNKVNKPQVKEVKEETKLLDLPEDQRPLVMLVPSVDGHYLKLKIEKINFKAKNVEYTLVYKTQDKEEGVPGLVDLEGKNSVEEDLLLGSESSGKFRYDEDVEFGSIEIRFNNDNGDMILRYQTDFHYQTGKEELSSVDGKFKYKLSTVPKNVHFVTLQTFGRITDADKLVASKDDYAVFASSSDQFKGNIE